MPLRSAARLEAVLQFSRSTSLMKKILVVACENNEVHRIAGNCSMKRNLCRAPLMAAVFILASVFVRDSVGYKVNKIASDINRRPVCPGQCGLDRTISAVQNDQRDDDRCRMIRDGDYGRRSKTRAEGLGVAASMTLTGSSASSKRDCAR